MSQVAGRSKHAQCPEPDDAELLVVDRVERELRKMISTSDSRLPQERDLADQYGVSRQSIRQAIARLKKEKLLRSVRGKGTFVVPRARRQTTVHLIAKSASSVYTMTFVGVLSDVLREYGYSAHIVTWQDSVPSWREISPDQEASSGGIIVGPIPRDRLARLMAESPTPLVHVSDMEEQVRTPPVCDTVLNDNAASSYRATEYLIRRGHRKIAILGWGPSMVWDHEWYRGYADALRLHGIEPDPEWSVRFGCEEQPQEVKPAHERVQRQIDRWRETGNVPTAIIHCGEDELRVRDIFREELRDLFRMDTSVVLSSWEMLQNTYRGKGVAVASTYRFRDLATRALDLLVRRRNDNGPPTREFHGRVFLGFRQDGIWREETPT